MATYERVTLNRGGRNSRFDCTIFFIEKISFSLKLFSGHFYGQSFIKTVRGPSALS